MKCRICGNKKENKLYETREMMFGYKDVFDYFQCSYCECLQIKDFPQDMSKYYPDNYYSYQVTSDQNKVRKFLLGLRDKYAVLGKGLIGKIIYKKYPGSRIGCLGILNNISKDTNILDVGCGTGSLLYSLSELGLTNLLGIDPFNVEDIEYANGLEIKKQEIYDVQGEWDIIMFHHSFEHIADQGKTLEATSRLLAHNGQCIIRIPTVSSYAWKHYGVDWVQLDAPRHFYLHSIESMKILAQQSGLELWNVVYDSNCLQFWGSEQYIAGIPLRNEKSYSGFSKSQISNFEKQSKNLNKINQGDQAVFYLRKATHSLS